MAFVNNLVLLEGFVAGEFKRIGDNGPAVGQISVSKRVKDQATKEYVTKYDYFDVKAWSPAREQMAGITDGTRIIVSGQLDRESWKDKTTEKTVYKTVVLVNTIAELPKIPDKDGPQGFEPSNKKDDWDF
jgi:single-stranded DNA-binding protein